MNSQTNPSNTKSTTSTLNRGTTERPFKKGAIIEGRIVDVYDQEVYVDLGLKSDCRVARSEFLETPEIGSTVAVVIKSKENDSEIYIASKLEADARKGWETVKEAFSKNLQVQGRVDSEVKNIGYNVYVEGVQLFLPSSQLGMKATLEELKAKPLDFKVIKLNEKGRTGVLSRKKLIEEISKEKWDELVKIVKVGDKVNGTVTKVASFGVFCNVHGIEGLLRQNDISYKKYAPFKQYFQIGQSIELLVLEIDPTNNRLSLGIKQLYEDPWVWAGRELEKDMVVRGIVTSLTNFGAFVELKEGLEGLIHCSELTWAKKPPHPKEVLKKGQEVDSMILDIDLSKKRLSLGLKQLLPNPWDNLTSEVRVGNTLEGKITGITKYGAFVEVENGIEGLIHVGDITWDEKVKDPTTVLKKGQIVKYQILDINLDTNRISCGLKQLQENPYEALKKKYPTGVIVEGKVKSIVTFGVFLEIEPGYEGLIHVSQIPESKTLKLEELYKVGDIIKAVILKIDPDSKKISLSVKDFDKAMEKEEISKYIKTDTPSSESFGSFINSSKS
ncbi:MAG TPA: 30S ribosomal protein S1 [Leptospiraceae bacterium]|nr:30S ribosomal protein S1 [Leptospiraceae bacterium]HRG45461.1 30S ribosomal protein S1 [Leptospiraceae bacterium]HRG74034.1 30S ribosomal protein S1 [Leptospiraceae bacterium]